MPTLRLKQLRLDGGTQMRVGVRNADAVSEYAQVLKDGGALPPVTVFHDGRAYWLADGFHRYSAHVYLDRHEIEADVRAGSQRDAILYAVGANASHGLRRTNADKRRAVEALLKDQEWGAWSDREIARASHTSHPFVAKARQEVTGNISSERTFTTKHGTPASMQTANIGQRPPAERQPPVVMPPTAPPSPRSSDDEFSSIVHTPGTLYLPPLPEAAPSEPVIQAEDLYIPFHEPEPQAMNPQEAEKRLKEIHGALERLVKQERFGRELLMVPDPYVQSVRMVARMAREMLDEWLDDSSEQEARTITIDALN